MIKKFVFFFFFFFKKNGGLRGALNKENQDKVRKDSVSNLRFLFYWKYPMRKSETITVCFMEIIRISICIFHVLFHKYLCIGIK